MSNQITKSTTRSGAEFKPELTSSETMTTPPGSAGESQLQNVVTALFEDRRAMQANVEALMRTVEKRTARLGATVEPTDQPVVT